MLGKKTIARPIVFLLILIALSALTIGFMINTNALHYALITKEIEKSKNIHLLINMMIKEEISKLSSFSKLLYRNQEIAQALRQYSIDSDLQHLQILINRLERDLHVGLIELIDKKGKIILSVNSDLPSGSRMKLWGIDEAMDGKVITSAAKTSRGWAIRAFAPVILENEHLGIVVLGTRINDSFAEKIAAATDTQITLAMMAEIVASSTPAKNLNLIDLKDPDLWYMLVEGNEPIFIQKKEMAKAFMYVAVRVIDETFCLVVQTDTHPMYDLLEKKRNHLLLISFIVFILIILFGSLSTIAIINPLNRLQKRARQMIKKYSDGDKKISFHGNEIQNLVRAFLLMEESIASTIAREELSRDQLLESEEKFRTITAAAQDAIVLMNRQGKITQWNEAAENIFGYSYLEMPALTFHDILSLSSQAMFGKKFEDFQKSGDKIFPENLIELMIIQKEGTKISVELSLSSVILRREWNAVGIFRDISERKIAEEKEEALQSQLLQSRKMEAIGTLAGGIAHDFNSMLMTIMINNEYVLEKTRENKSVQESLELSQKAANRARNLIKQILTFSRKDEKERTNLSVFPIVEETMEMLRSSLPSTIEIKMEIEKTSAMILGSSAEIQQVLINLCNNAAHAMKDKKGVLTVRLIQKTSETFRNIKTESDVLGGNYIKLTVKDNGEGMPLEVVDKIFDPFYTTKKTGEGTGMGLAVVHGILNSLGSIIMVDSEPGIGTVFDVFLPINSHDLMGHNEHG